MDAEARITVRDLRTGIETDQLVVYYQPKISIKAKGDQEIVGCEALVRWRHPQHGLMFPDEFIPLAEKSGLIVALTDCVVGATVKQIRRWRDDGLRLTVAVNIAPQLLDDLGLPDRIHERLKEYDLQTSQLVLEVTESGAMENAARAMEILARFRLKGFGLSLDDFGTGYSSLVQLHRMPFNEMKIDKSFLMAMDQDEEARNIVSSIIDLGHNIGLQLCAEGVETRESLDMLRSLGCELAQGYYMSPPIPGDEIAPWRNQWKN